MAKTEAWVQTAQHSRSYDAVVTARPRAGIELLTVCGPILTLGVPVMVAVLLGPEPYEAIRLRFPGFTVAVLIVALKALASLSAMVSIGGLVSLLFLRDASRRLAKVIPQGFEIQILRIAALVWAASSFALIIFSALDRGGAEISELATPGAFGFLYQASYAPAAWTLNAAAALVVLFCAYLVDRWTGLLIPLWAACIGILAPVVTGQLLVGPNHDFGSDAGAVQAIAIHILFGTLLVFAIRVSTGRLIAPGSLKRLMIVCALCLPIVVITDLIIAWFKLAGTPITASLTGRMILAGWFLLALLCAGAVLAWWLARTGRLRAVHVSWLSIGGAIGVLGWIGIATAMTQQPPPQYFVPTSIAQNLLGFDVDAPPTFEVLVGHWRVNVLFLFISLAMSVMYLAAVMVLRRRGDRWPVGRTISWLLGWGIVVLATSSGFGKYSGPDFGVHMIVHMSLNMLAPGFLVTGGVITLLLRATRSGSKKSAGVHDWITWVLHWPLLRLIYNPMVVFVLFVSSYYALYLTPVFGELMRFHWGHQAMNVHFLIVGYLYYSLIIGVDRPPRPLPHIGKLGYALAAMPFHAFFGVIMMTSKTLVAQNFYEYLGLPWADIPAQQYVAGGVAWAGGEIPLLVVIIILVVQWSRQDSKEAKRTDRHFDTGRDDEFDVYNEMLIKLAARESARTGAARKTPEKDASDEN